MSACFRYILFVSFSAFFACSTASRVEGPLPNILLIVLDAARADHFSCYGYHRETTPNIDRLAAEGLRFSRAVSSSSWTLPAHATLFTGLLPSEHGTHMQHNWLAESIPTLAQLLKTRGYRTAGFSNNPYIGSTNNLAKGFEIVESVWADSAVITQRKPHNTEHTNKLVRRFLEKGDSQEAPFFVFINYMDVHNPYDPPEPYRSLYLKEGQQVSTRIDSVNHDQNLVNKGPIQLSAGDSEILCALYDGALNYLDAKIQELLDCLKQRGLYENTLVVVTSDHGEVFGSYGLLGHRVFLYRPLVHIPLIIRHKRLTGPPETREALVSIGDIFYTIVRLVGMEGRAAPTGAPVSYLLDPGIREKPCYSELKVGRIRLKLDADNDLRSVWTPEDYHFILCEGESYKCYDLASDFEEQHNLCPSKVSKEQIEAEVTGFESSLVRFVEKPEDLRITREQRVDPRQERAMRALGYVGDSHPDLLSLAVDEHPHVMEHLKTGIFFFFRDSLNEAEREIRKTLAMNPTNPVARKYLGGLLFRQGRHQEAVRVLRSIIDRTDVDAEVRMLLAQSLAALGKKEEALEQLQIVSRMRLKAPDSYFQAAGMLIEMGDFKTADVFSINLLKEHPDQLQVVRQLIGLHCRYENWDTARRLLLHEIANTPSPVAYLLLSRVLAEMGRPDEARRNIEKALSMDRSPRIRAEAEKLLNKLSNQ
ncbi:MAG TPA: sulfatase-like hydrolase/transferase [archaeon]|nr:sulfatase-like hydrolase/transferase [archaeon]